MLPACLPSIHAPLAGSHPWAKPAFAPLPAGLLTPSGDMAPAPCASLQADLIDGKARVTSKDKELGGMLHQEWAERQDQADLQKVLRGLKNGFRRRRGAGWDDEVSEPSCEGVSCAPGDVQGFPPLPPGTRCASMQSCRPANHRLGATLPFCQTMHTAGCAHECTFCFAPKKQSRKFAHSMHALLAVCVQDEEAVARRRRARVDDEEEPGADLGLLGPSPFGDGAGSDEEGEEKELLRQANQRHLLADSQVGGTAVWERGTCHAERRPHSTCPAHRAGRPAPCAGSSERCVLSWLWDAGAGQRAQ